MDIQTILEQSAARHSHLCPRQVLGVRIGLLAVRIFNFSLGDNPKKQLLAIVESDGCFSDGVEAATGCTLGHRTLRLEDQGKIAAVFVDIHTGRAVRISPRPDVREHACQCLPDEPRHYFAQLQAYQVMPDNELLTTQDVILNMPVEKIISRPGLRVNCAACGEEIINEREVTSAGFTLCQTCAGAGYYRPAKLSISNYANAHLLFIDSK